MCGCKKYRGKVAKIIYSSKESSWNIGMNEKEPQDVFFTPSPTES